MLYFKPIFFAVLKVLIITFICSLFTKSKIIKEEQLESFSTVLIYLFLPCLILSNILTNFYPDSFKNWYILPLGGIGIFLIPFFLSNLIFLKKNDKNYLIALSTIQNAGYLILPIGWFLFPENPHTFTMYVLLFVLSASPILWSIGYFLMTQRNFSKFTFINSFKNPPFIANIFSLFLVFTGIREKLPEFFFQIVGFLAKPAIPLALFILGARLSLLNLKGRGKFYDALKVVLIKMVLTPLVVLIILKTTKIINDHLMKTIFILEASSPPAVGLIIQATAKRTYTDKIGFIILICYISSVFLMPLWLSLLF
ncbi:MAG: hypothetical protein DRP67_04625 [Candidatus Omnitrophota bacterium]|nr:MAG: hypothetical protein DRP67_04625 [Candidatus Omnitrophota bacterium]